MIHIVLCDDDPRFLEELRQQVRLQVRSVAQVVVALLFL